MQQHNTGQGGRQGGRGGRRASRKGAGSGRELRRAGGGRIREGNLDERADDGRGQRASKRVKEEAGHHCCCPASSLALRCVKYDKRIVIQ